MFKSLPIAKQYRINEKWYDILMIYKKLNSINLILHLL